MSKCGKSVHCGGIWLNTDILCSTLSADTLPKSELTVYIASNLSATNTDLTIKFTKYCMPHTWFCGWLFTVHCTSAILGCTAQFKNVLLVQRSPYLRSMFSCLKPFIQICLISLNKLSKVIFSESALQCTALLGNCRWSRSAAVLLLHWTVHGFDPTAAEKTQSFS